MNRRRRRLVGAIAGIALAPGMVLVAPAGAVSARVRWGLLIDTTKCKDGCQTCVEACRNENGWRQSGDIDTDPQWIRIVTVSDRQGGATRRLPVMCQHCRRPSCVDVCPTGASFKRADNVVLVDKHICIGCRYCMMACPYKARSFVFSEVEDQKPHAPRGKGTVESCTLCVHRIDDGRIPACVEACPGALTFGDLYDPDSAISRQASRHLATRIRADLGLEPGVLYLGL
ncbi:MAG: 4Fe-4S dicluster domain-containing protein [Candidatus Glassbacteria bacterium]|nr:4Fe-4S dicluster domain-containing protein [Candidatus Glassbacteria bacterium]